MLAPAEVTGQGPSVLQVADAVLDADPLGGVDLAFGLVGGGEGGQDRQLVSPRRPWSDQSTGGLRARALGPGIDEQGDAGNEGQQLDRAGLAGLGQIAEGARAGLPAERQPPGRVGEDQRLDGVARAAPETNRCRPDRPAAGWRTHTSVESGRPTCRLAPRWATTSARVRSRTPPSSVQPRSVSSGRTSPMAG
jgi:hypothetical protein